VTGFLVLVNHSVQQLHSATTKHINRYTLCRLYGQLDAETSACSWNDGKRIKDNPISALLIINGIYNVTMCYFSNSFQSKKLGTLTLETFPFTVGWATGKASGL